MEWAPAGRHEIHASIGDAPWTGYVEAREEDARRLDAQLQRLLAKAEAGEISRPYIDFDHAPGPAAAIPVRFYWEDGIRLEVQWTSQGESALRGRTYSYFSPEVHIDDLGRPVELPTPGAIGGLVNSPAFQRIERLAASAQRKDTAPMDITIKAAVSAGIVPDGVTDADKAADYIRQHADKLKAAESERAKLLHDLGEARRITDQVTAERKAGFEAELDEAIKAGRLHPDARELVLKAMVEDPETGRKLFAQTAKRSARQESQKGAEPVPVSDPRIEFGSEEEDRIRAAHGKERMKLRAEAYNSGLRRLKSANTIDTALVFSVMRDAVITVLGEKLAPIGAFTTDFGANEVGPRRPVTVTIASASLAAATAGGAVINATNFHQTFTTLNDVVITPNQITMPWGLLNADIQNGYRMAAMAQANAQAFAEAVMGQITALWTTAIFTRTPLTSKVSQYPDPGFPLAWFAIAKGRRRIFVAAPEIYAKAMFIPGGAAFVMGPDQNSPGVITGPRALGFDGLYYQTIFTGASAGVRGFVCDPQAIACVSGLPIKPNELVPVHQSTASIPDLPGMTVAMHISGDSASRSPFASYDIVFGAAVGDVSAGVLVIPAAEALLAADPAAEEPEV